MTETQPAAMADLLSKDHRITEKGMMEFRPFGVDAQGNKIRDASGVTVVVWSVSKNPSPKHGDERQVKRRSRISAEC
jgi:hypothetical protein